MKKIALASAFYLVAFATLSICAMMMTMQIGGEAMLDTLGIYVRSVDDMNTYEKLVLHIHTDNFRNITSLFVPAGALLLIVFWGLYWLARRIDPRWVAAIGIFYLVAGVLPLHEMIAKGISQQYSSTAFEDIFPHQVATPDGKPIERREKVEYPGGMEAAFANAGSVLLPPAVVSGVLDNVWLVKIIDSTMRTLEIAAVLTAIFWPIWDGVAGLWRRLGRRRSGDEAKAI